jgi:hypothetical protein
MSERQSCINMRDEFWGKLQELKTALEAFSPHETITDDFYEQTPGEKIASLKYAINVIGSGRSTFRRISELNAALRRVSDATDETSWLMRELRTRSDPSANKVLDILESMKDMVLNAGNQYYTFEYIAGPEMAKRGQELHFLLSQLRDHCDS